MGVIRGLWQTLRTLRPSSRFPRTLFTGSTFRAGGIPSHFSKVHGFAESDFKQRLFDGVPSTFPARSAAAGRGDRVPRRFFDFGGPKEEAEIADPARRRRERGQRGAKGRSHECLFAGSLLYRPRRPFFKPVDIVLGHLA